MAGTADDLLWKLAESDEVDIETRRDSKSPLHRTTIWIVPAKDGVYVRSVKGKKGRWYQEAIANPHVAVRVGQRTVAAKAELEQRISREPDDYVSLVALGELNLRVGLIADAQQVGQLLHPGDDRHLLGDQPVQTTVPGQGRFQPLLDCSPVGLHVVVDVGFLAPQQRRHLRRLWPER